MGNQKPNPIAAAIDLFFSLLTLPFLILGSVISGIAGLLMVGIGCTPILLGLFAILVLLALI